MQNKIIKLTECPRDAMQGLSNFVSTQHKVNYINSLIKVGFDVIDFGSFVSPKAMPQMRDTDEVVKLLNIKNSTELLSIVLNKRGALLASSFEQIKILGYPLSISEKFQNYNSNNNIQSALSIIDEIQNICIQKNKKLLIYFSMAFGNPYGENWNSDLLASYIQKIQAKGIDMISLADTVGASNNELITNVYRSMKNDFNQLDIGLHLHSLPSETYSKINSAWSAGCERFDIAMGGYGGCPFAQDKLVGNISTEQMLNFLAHNKIKHSLNLLAFENASNYAKKIFIS